jgi:hypothetical protein
VIADRRKGRRAERDRRHKVTVARLASAASKR